MQKLKAEKEWGRKFDDLKMASMVNIGHSRHSTRFCVHYNSEVSFSFHSAEEAIINFKMATVTLILNVLRRVRIFDMIHNHWQKRKI